MSIETNLHGRLRNTILPYHHGLLPMFEAVSNSIHAIEEAGLSPSEGKIIIEIIRDTQSHLDLSNDHKKPGPDPNADITGFKIIDNGIGFTDTNMNSFLTLDSEHKANIGGRGVGRLMWLKAFNHTTIKSFYEDKDGELKLRAFTFSASSGVMNGNNDVAPVDSEKNTVVHLAGFLKKYREATYKTTEAIAKSLLEHCLWYFVRQGGAPPITIKDNDKLVNLDRIYEEQMVSETMTETITIKDTEFNLTHIKLRANSSKPHVVAFCAANRLVKEENLKGKVPGLYGNICDSKGEFVYACYVSSEFLNERVRAERTGFDINEEPLDLFAESEISQKDISAGVITKAIEYLSDYLEESKQKGRERIESYVSHHNPRYRPILTRIPEDKLNVDPDISDKDLELTLHKQLAKIEAELLSEGHDIMFPETDESYDTYKTRLQEYLDKAEDIKKSDLASYVSHRKVIIDLMEKAIEKDKEGRYCREEFIHKLIMPLRTDSNDVMPDSCNLWLIDESLAFHDYLSSDKPLCSMPITNSSEKKEPDICALNIFDNPMLVSEDDNFPSGSIVVVELKRPMRNDAAEGEDKDPIEQALGYLDRIKRGTVLNHKGRLIPKSENIPGFCYIICDNTKSIQKRCKMHDTIPTSDGLGYFCYKKSYNAFVEIVTFDRLVKLAKERNRAFFNKLGLPTK